MPAPVNAAGAPARVATLEELCDVVRTKNAGPFLFTLDLIFRRREDYEAVKAGGQLDRRAIAAAYGVPEDEVVAVEHADGILAVKATLRRRHAAGAPGDSDCYGMSQEAPVLGLQVHVGPEQSRG
jgi:hypothetical protein